MHKTIELKAEEILREKEELYRTIFENTGTATIIFEEDATITLANAKFAELAGYTRDEIENKKKWTEFVVEEDLEMMKTRYRLRRFDSSATPESYEIRAIDRHDGIRNILLTVDTIPAKNQCIASLLDITENKRAEEELRLNEEKYRSVLKDIQEGYFEVDLSGNFTFFNDSLCRYFDCSREELMGMNYRQYTDNEHSKKLFQAFNKVYNSGEPIEGFNWQVIRKDGTKRYIEASVSLRKDSSGKPTGFRGIARDVTERKIAEEELRKSDEKYLNIFENAVEGIYQSTIEGRFITANAALARMTGYDSPEELIESIKDMGTQLYVHPEDRKRFLEIRDTKGFVDDFEVEFYKKDGNTFWGVINARTVKDEKGEILYFEGFIEDITIRKHAEERLHQTLGRLRKAVITTIQVLVSAVESRDPYTSGHQVRVAHLARAIATEMGLLQDKIDSIRMAGSIHDIGKLSVPAEILSKPTKLTDIELSLIKEHSRVGYEMLKDVESPWPLAEIIYQHHECMNGSGYPRNLKGDDILMEARIMAVADIVEAMASHRPYRPALGIEAALEEIEKNKGILYDDTVANACLKLFREKDYQLT
ncbi:MAG: PAS domain S-box protein [Smithella sp.]